MAAAVALYFAASSSPSPPSGAPSRPPPSGASAPVPPLMLPDWAPNVHPLVVHFPIALLFVAALVDAVALIARDRLPWARTSAVGLYALGALSAAASLLTGRAASDDLELPVQALTTLNAHADWALYLTWFAGLYALARVAALRYDRERRLAVHLPLAALGLVGLFLVQQTAERGGRMVYQYGVAVAAVEIEDPAHHDHRAHGPGAHPDDPEGADHHNGEHGDHDEDGGGEAAPRAASGLPDLQPLAGPRPQGGALTAAPGRPAFAATGGPVGDLEAQVTLDLSGFTGTAMLAHHVRDAQNYDFLAVETGSNGTATLRQGRVADGVETTFDTGTATLAAPVALKTYAVGTHFRGYADDTQVTHGHGDAAPPGRVGVRADGTGTVRVLALSVTSVE